MSLDARPTEPPYHAMLRFLDHQLPADEVSTLVERLRGDEAARRQAAGLLLQIGTFGELARDPGQDRLPVRRQPPARWPLHRKIGLLAGACALAAILLLVIGKPVAPVRPRTTDRHAFARPTGDPRAVTQIGSAGEVLLIRGGGADAPDAPDQVMIQHLEGLGFTVVQAIDADVSADDLSGRTLVVISATSSGNVLRQRLPDLGLRDAPIPIVTCESSTFDLLGMTGPRFGTGPNAGNGFGATPDHQDIEIESPEHPLAAGLRGHLRIANAPVPLSWGAPAPGAINVAHLSGTRARPMKVQFAYDKGVPMVGLVAPARRVACFISVDGAERLTAQGWQLFDAGVRWAASL